MLFRTRLLAGALLSTALGVTALPAHAQVDAQAVVNAVTEMFKRQGVTVTVGSVESDGADIVAKDITVQPADLNAAKVEEVVLEQVEQTENGWIVGRIGWPAFKTEKDGIAVDFGGAALEGFYVPGPNETDPILKAGFYRGVVVGAVKVDTGGKTVFSMSGAKTTMTDYQPGGTLEFEGSVEGVEADLSAIPDAKTQAAIQAMGYEQVSGGITMSGSWDTSAGQMAIDEMTYSVDDAADLSLAFDISGYTPQLLAAIQEMQANTQMDEQAKGMAMLGLMQQLTFNSASIRLEDASLTGKVLDFVAQQQGVNRAQLVEQTKGMLPFVLAGLKNPDFATKAAAAVGRFLDDPQSLEISAEPSQPVPVAQIMASGMTAPETLTTVLGVDVTANEDGE